MTLITGGVYPAQALLFAYSIYAFMNPDIPYMRNRANLYSLCWLLVAIALFFGYGTYQLSFGYAAQKMVLPVGLSNAGSTCAPHYFQLRPSTKHRVL